MFAAIILRTLESPCCGRACRNSWECGQGSWQPTSRPLTAPLMAPSATLPSQTRKTISPGRSGRSNKTEMCVNIHQKERTGDSTSNMNGLSTGPLMCLSISEHIKSWMLYVGCCELPEDLCFLRVSNDWIPERLWCLVFGLASINLYLYLKHSLCVFKPLVFLYLAQYR